MCTNLIAIYCHAKATNNNPPNQTTRYNSDMNPPTSGKPKFTIKITPQAQLEKDAPSIRDPPFIYPTYTAMNIRGAITTWLAPTISLIHPMSNLHRLICITLLYAMTTFLSDPNISITLLISPTTTTGTLDPYNLTNTMPIFKMIPAKIIEPLIDASTCTFGNHWCSPYTGNLDKPISMANNVITPKSKLEIRANLNVNENHLIYELAPPRSNVLDSINNHQIIKMVTNSYSIIPTNPVRLTQVQKTNNPH